MMRFRAYHRACAFLSALWLILPLSVAAPAAGSQRKPQSGAAPAKESRSERPFAFKVPVNVVLVNVTATDKAGKPVKDLSVDDFKVYEDGKRQQIQSFELESSQPVGAMESVDPASTQPGAQAPGSERTRTRLISYFIDDLTEHSAAFFGWAIWSLQEFMAEGIGPRDRVGVFSASGSVRIPFSGDLELLRDKIEDLKVGQLDLRRPRRYMSDVRAIKIVEGVLKYRVNPFEQFNAWRQYDEVQAAIHGLLGTLRRHLRYLQHFRGSKSLVLLSEGFVPGRRMRWRVDRMVDQALLARVTLNAVDIKGLEISPLNDHTAFGDFTMQSLAEDTGGIFYRDSNDLVAGLREIRDAQSFHYVLSYASPDQEANGKYHRIRVKVDRPGLKLRYREGYFAPREKRSPEDRKNEDYQLAREAPGDFDQIPLQLAFESSRLANDRFRLSVLTSVNIGGIRFRGEAERRRNLIHLVVAIYDQEDEYVKGSEKRIDLNLSQPSYLTMLRQGFTAKTDVEIPAGRYTVKAVVRENNQAKMGSLQQRITLPFKGGEARGVTVAEKKPSRSFALAGLESSKLILSQRVTRLADLSDDQQQRVLEKRDALIFKDVQIHSLVDDQIDRRYPVTFFYTLYNLKYPEESAGMTARIQLTGENGRVIRFPLVLLGEGKVQPWAEGSMTVAFNLSFKELQPGKYKLTVMTSVPAASGQSVASRTAVTVLD